MASHSYHPLNGGFDEPILFDDCEGCEAHTGDLGLSLDKDNWMRVWGRMLVVEFENGGVYRSQNEAILGRQMYHMAVVLERYMGIDPRTSLAP